MEAEELHLGVELVHHLAKGHERLLVLVDILLVDLKIAESPGFEFFHACKLGVFWGMIDVLLVDLGKGLERCSPGRPGERREGIGQGIENERHDRRDYYSKSMNTFTFTLTFTLTFESTQTQQLNTPIPRRSAAPNPLPHNI